MTLKQWCLDLAADYRKGTPRVTHRYDPHWCIGICTILTDDVMLWPTQKHLLSTRIDAELGERIFLGTRIGLHGRLIRAEFLERTAETLDAD